MEDLSYIELADIELVERATGGDGRAFESLVSRHYELVYRVAYKWCGVRENAEDITQEVFVKLARSIEGYKGSSAFMTWLYRVTVNTAKDYIRANARKINNESAYMKEEAYAGRANSSDSNPASSEELYRALASISPKLKETVILVLGEGLSHKEAADVLGCAETTISWRVFKARRQLTKFLKEEA